jgi:hypothetical protein
MPKMPHADLMRTHTTLDHAKNAVLIYATARMARLCPSDATAERSTLGERL